MAILTACQNETTAENEVLDEDKVDYYGTYMKVETGELDGDYFDDYEAVPLETPTNDSMITLKSNGTYEAEHTYYSEEYGDIHRVVTNKYEYSFDEDEIIRNRDITTENFKSFDKIYKNDYGDLRVNYEYIDKIEADNATIIKDEDEYVIYDRTEYKINNNEHDGEDNHLEYDFITIEGNLISVNYYYDDDRTVVSVYHKVD